MPNTKLTKERIKNHLHYGKWIYILIAVGGFFLFDLVFTMTQYRSPAERKVDFEFVSGGVVQTDALAEMTQIALADGQTFDETLEEVSAYAINYSGDASADYYGAQKYTVMIAAQEGDIYIVNRFLFEQLNGQEALTPLDDYIASGAIDTTGMDLDTAKLSEPSGETDAEGAPIPSNGAEHVYGIPLAGYEGLRSIGIDTSDSYAVLMAYSKNPDTCVRVLGSMLAQLKDPIPGLVDGVYLSELGSVAPDAASGETGQ